MRGLNAKTKTTPRSKQTQRIRDPKIYPTLPQPQGHLQLETVARSILGPGMPGYYRSAAKRESPRDRSKTPRMEVQTRE